MLRSNVYIPFANSLCRLVCKVAIVICHLHVSDHVHTHTVFVLHSYIQIGILLLRGW